MQAQYVRTHRGRKIHHRDCRFLHAAAVAPWPWANGRTPEQIHAQLREMGLLNQLSFCRTCFAPWMPQLL